MPRERTVGTTSKRHTPRLPCPPGEARSHCGVRAEGVTPAPARVATVSDDRIQALDLGAAPRYPSSSRCGRGETGRRTRLKILRRKAWGFEPPRPHHQLRQVLGSYPIEPARGQLELGEPRAGNSGGPNTRHVSTALASSARPRRRLDDARSHQRRDGHLRYGAPAFGAVMLRRDTVVTRPRPRSRGPRPPGNKQGTMPFSLPDQGHPASVVVEIDRNGCRCRNDFTERRGPVSPTDSASPLGPERPLGTAAAETVGAATPVGRRAVRRIGQIVRRSRNVGSAIAGFRFQRTTTPSGISMSRSAEARHLPCASRASDRVTPPPSACCITKLSAPRVSIS